MAFLDNVMVLWHRAAVRIFVWRSLNDDEDVACTQQCVHAMINCWFRQGIRVKRQHIRQNSEQENTEGDEHKPQHNTILAFEN